MPAGDFGDRPGAALVVGGSGGIGAAVCRALAGRSSHVALTFRRDRAAAAEVVAEVEDAGREGAAWPLEVGEADAAATVVARAAERFGGIHTLVYAAGPVVAQRHLSELDPATYAGHVHVEAVGFFNVLRPAIALLRASRGSLVAVTTAATQRFPARDGLSASPKAAVEALVRAVAVEEGRYGVRANCVGPGLLAGGMADTLQDSGDLDDAAIAAGIRAIPLRRRGRPDDVAAAVCFLASPAAGYITGQHLAVDGGWSA